MKKLLKEFADAKLISEVLISAVSPLPKVDGAYPQNQSLPGVPTAPSPVAPTPAQAPKPVPMAPTGVKPEGPEGKPENPEGEKKPEEKPGEKEEAKGEQFSFMPDVLASIQEQVEGLSSSLSDFMGRLQDDAMKTELNQILIRFGLAQVEAPKEEPKETEEPKENPEESKEEAKGVCESERDLFARLTPKQWRQRESEKPFKVWYMTPGDDGVIFGDYATKDEAEKEANIVKSSIGEKFPERTKVWVGNSSQDIPPEYQSGVITPRYGVPTSIVRK